VRQIGDVCVAIFGVFYPMPYATAHVHSLLGSWLHFTPLVPSRVAAYGNLPHTGCLPGNIYGGIENAKLGHSSPPPVQWKLIYWSTLVF
jgi:hypothetical protein